MSSAGISRATDNLSGFGVDKSYVSLSEYVLLFMPAVLLLIYDVIIYKKFIVFDLMRIYSS